jgi:hypothetical protein
VWQPAGVVGQEEGVATLDLARNESTLTLPLSVAQSTQINPSMGPLAGRAGSKTRQNDPDVEVDSRLRQHDRPWGGCKIP